MQKNNINKANVGYHRFVSVPVAAVDVVDQQGSVPVAAQVDLLSACCGVLISDVAVTLIK